MSDSHAFSPPPEPRTPLWLPAVGAALFAVAGIGWALCPAATPAAAPPPAPTAAAAAPAPTPTPAPIRTAPLPLPRPVLSGAPAAPSASASAGRPRLGGVRPPPAPKQH